MQIYIYANGGESIGYGHLVRTDVLATEFLSDGHKVTYLTRTSETTQEVVADDAAIVSVESPSAAVSVLDSKSVDILISDSYEIDHDLQRQFSAVVPKFCVAMDRNPHPIHCDVLINGNLYADQLTYQWTGSEPRWCLGPEYVLLRERIRMLAEENPPWHELPKRALVTMGGSDIANLTPTVLRAFSNLNLRIDTIVGPGFSQSKERRIRKVASDIPVNTQVVRDPDDLVERMFQADFAVSTASSTTYELLALGTPIVSIPVADNQKSIATALRECDVATVLECEAKEVTFRHAIEEYMMNASLRRNRREQGRKLIDGQGTERVRREILSLVD